jgi:putative transposase
MPRYPEHIRGFEYVGFARCFLTFCTYERRRYFDRADKVDIVRDQFLRAAAEQAFEIIAYCFMPDHVHLLVEATREDADLKRFTKLAKQLSGFYVKQARGEPLWQRYGYEHVLRHDEATPAVAKYIVENPIRAGLVVTPLDYPHWGSFVCSRGELLDYIERAA